MGKDKKTYEWVGRGVLKIRGKLYGKGVIPTDEIPEKVLEALIKGKQLRPLRKAAKVVDNG
jgi:hypothetical protein